MCPIKANLPSLLRKGGRVVLIGIPKAPIHIEDPMPNVLFKSLTLTTVHGRRIWHTWEACEALVAAGKVTIASPLTLYSDCQLCPRQVDPTLIISHTFTLDTWQEAFDMLLSGKACKIVVKI